MNLQHKICLCTKTTNFEKLNFFVDNIPIRVNNSEYIWLGDTGKHTIRIEQYKIIKSKYYHILCPIYFFLSLFSGDSEFDGKTPFYAVYEAEISVDKDIEIHVELYDVNRNIKKSKQGFCYKVDVDFPKETEAIVIKNEFTATPQEKKRWFVYYAALWTIVFTFSICIFILAGINSLKKGIGILGTIFCGFLSCLSIVGWISFIYRYYKWSNWQQQQ